MKTRVLTSVILLPLLLIALLALPKLIAAIAIGAMAAIAAYELLHVTGLVKNMRLVLYSMVAAFLCALWSYFGADYAIGYLGVLLFVAVLFGEMMCSHVKLRFASIALCLFGGLLIPFMLGSLVRIHVTVGTGRYLVLIPFVIAFLSDTGAYFIGRSFGRHKLSPVISPNKTVEGAIGGIAAAVLGMVLFCLVLRYAFGFTVNYFFAIVYGLIGSLSGIFGDLSFSAIKRQTGLKDYGNLLPGHGGILDRFDSVIFVSAVVEILLILIPVAVK